MKTIILVSIALIATMRISRQQDDGSRIKMADGRRVDDDPNLNPYPMAPHRNHYCQSLPNFFSQTALNDLSKRFGCFFKFISEESMFKDVSRVRLHEFFRNQSELLANGTCPYCFVKSSALNKSIRYSNIFLMRQHWFLEYSAYFFFGKYGCPLSLAQKIDGQDFPESGNNHLGTLPDIRECDIYFAVTSIKITEEEKQEDAVESFIKSMMLANDLLRTWNDTDYILGSASHYGCAVIVKDNVTGISGHDDILEKDRAAYLACLFVAHGSLESYRGVLDDSSCDRSFGIEKYFSSFQAPLCVHRNLQRSPVHRVILDIACEIEYNQKNLLDEVEDFSHDVGKNFSHDAGMNKNFSEHRVNGSDEGSVGGRYDTNYSSSLDFFLLAAPVTFLLLAFITLLRSSFAVE